VQFAGPVQVIRRTISKNHTIAAVVSGAGQTGNAPVPDTGPAWERCHIYNLQTE